MKKSVLPAATLIAITAVLFLAAPASAVLTNINQGDTVFLGEEGLVLSDDVFYNSDGVYDNQIAYFAGSNPTTDQPKYVITPTKGSFFVDPSTFSDRLGQWNSYPNGSKNGYISFFVKEPAIGMKLWAYRPGGESFDITNGKIVKGEALDFRIDSNLYPIFQRSGVVPGDDGIDIIVENQVGATLSALYDCSGTPVSIVNIHPTSQQFFLPDGTLTCVWDTGNEQYNTGSYNVWAECNVNGMENNLGAIVGQTVTEPISSLQSTQTPTDTIETTQTQTTSTATPTTEATTAPVVTETETQVYTGVSTHTMTQETTQDTTPTEAPISPLTLVFSAMAAMLIAMSGIKKSR